MGQSNVLITGGAGFIGRELAAQCVRQGHTVTVIDDLCAGRLENLAELGTNITFHRLSILDQCSLREVYRHAKPDVVFHLAAHHFIPFCNAHPRETLQVNVEGTFVVLDEAARAGTSVAVLASSGSIYPSLDCPLTEELSPAPVDIYGTSKLLMEGIAEFVASTSPLSCVVARLFNVYGPYETNPHLIPDIVLALRSGYDIRLGNIQTKRDYVYVEDVASHLIRCTSLSERGYSVVNIGTGEEHSAEDIVSAIAALIGHELNITTDTSKVRSVDKLHQRADTQRLEQWTGSKPMVRLSEGLSRLLSHEGFDLAPAPRR